MNYTDADFIILMQSTKSNVTKHQWVLDMFLIRFVLKIVKVIEVLHNLMIYKTFSILKTAIKQFCETNDFSMSLRCKLFKVKASISYYQFFHALLPVHSKASRVMV